MKNLFICLALLFTILVTAQEKITEGIVISSQKMTTDNEQLQGQLAMMGDMKTTTYFKDKKSRSELSNPMSGDVITITDTETKETLMLMDNPMLGKKYMFKTADDLEDVDVVEGKETKTILGYTCKQYIVTINQGGVDMKMDLFTTEAILAEAQQTAMLGDKLKGFPLYMSMSMNQMGSDMTIITEVTEIKKESVSDDLFSMTPPEGYEKMSGQ
jgi:outer membrane lipoprotein-sorting protein